MGIPETWGTVKISVASLKYPSKPAYQESARTGKFSESVGFFELEPEILGRLGAHRITRLITEVNEIYNQPICINGHDATG